MTPDNYEEVWSEVAVRTRGRFEPQGGALFWSSPAKVTATLGTGIDVVVDHRPARPRGSASATTQVRADARGSAELRVRLVRRGVFARVRTTLGLRHVELGHDAFDTAFLVRANDHELARAWLSARVRAAILACGPDYRLSLRRGIVRAERGGFETDPDCLLAAMHAVAMLAVGGDELLDRWRALADELGGSLVAADHFAAGQVRIDLERDGHHVAVATQPGPEVATQVRRELGRRDAPDFELAPAAPWTGAGPGAQAAADAWQAIQPARLRCDGEAVVISWPGILADATRVKRALALVTAVSIGAELPYR